MLYDSLLVFAIWILVGFAVLSSFGLEQARTLEGEMVVMDALVKNTLFTAMLLSAFLFFGFFWTHSGQTLGMQAWRIRVLRNDGGSISWKQAAIRFACAWKAGLIRLPRAGTPGSRSGWTGSRSARLRSGSCGPT
jgi:uncharacterized RDD family membrane protein YckC